jgi:hypothetical protein
MASDVDNLVLQHLIALRNELRDFRSDTRAELKLINERLNHIDKGVLALRRDAVATDEGAALQRVEFERLAARVERIERRLELSGEPKD